MKKKIGMVILCAAAFLFGFYFIPTPEEEPPKPYRAPKIIITYTPADVSFAFKCKENKQAAKAVLDDAGEIFETIDTLTFPTKTMILTSLGTYYITGYTSIECGGSTTTASGTTCHKGNPTTCAIDPKLHNFGDLFYIEEFDQVYIAEDTGSAVKGKHLDLYFWDDEYSYALSITGYYEVFAVEYEYGEVLASNYNIKDLVAEEGGLAWNYCS